ncbi:transposase domain-containing protein [Gluconobacter cerinus]|uniref:transposase domain-containing protein n=1 Tax=Gluconobacter cerinus TaxID=38307 RepID=UPI0038D21BF9
MQDIFSGKILSSRIDISKNKKAVRLAFEEMVERYGIPKHCFRDYGSNFASKWLAGDVPNRYRFKKKSQLLSFRSLGFRCTGQSRVGSVRN